MTDEGLRGAIVSVLRSEFADLQLVLLFGSHARGAVTPASDVDVALLVQGTMPAARLAELRDGLALALVRDVHLVDLRAATTVLRHEIAHTGEVLYSVGGGAVEAFLDFVLSDYVRLNEARAGILRDVRERGRVHGR